MACQSLQKLCRRMGTSLGAEVPSFWLKNPKPQILLILTSTNSLLFQHYLEIHYRMQPVAFKYTNTTAFARYHTSLEVRQQWFFWKRNAKANQRKCLFISPRTETISNWAELRTNKSKNGKYPETNPEKHQEEQRIYLVKALQTSRKAWEYKKPNRKAQTEGCLCREWRLRGKGKQARDWRIGWELQTWTTYTWSASLYMSCFLPSSISSM